MAGINDVFNIGRTGLLAFQRGITVTSHNIANQTTRGFSKQDAKFVMGRPQGGLVPTGVLVAKVQRNVDQFIETQLTSTTQEFGRLQTRRELLRQVEGVFTETDSVGLSHELNDLFNTFRNLSNAPEDNAIRTIVLNDAVSLGLTFNHASTLLSKQRTDIDVALQQNLISINNFASQIASLNKDIQVAEVGKEVANDLRDKRGTLINDLANLVSIDIIEQTDGVAINVGGQLLVSGQHANSLVRVVDADNGGVNDVAIKRSDNSTIVITSKLTEGRIKGQLEVRDADIVAAQDRLDRIAAVVINEINQRHQTGYGLDGTTNNALFAALAPSAPVARDGNTGGAAGTSTSILTAASLTMDTYEIQFTSSTLFNVVNITDTTTVLSAQTYTSGGNIDFDGLRVVLTNGASGPAANDVFTMSGHKGAAASFAVSLTNTDKIAASSTLAGTPGNNVNALALANIQIATQSALGNVTLNAYHAETIADVGSDTADAKSRLSTKQAQLDQVQGFRDSVSGVNLDEELTTLLSYQRAYEASARLITTADNLFQTVLGLGL